MKSEWVLRIDAAMSISTIDFAAAVDGAGLTHPAHPKAFACAPSGRIAVVKQS
jgi:hypothetical protein